MTGSAAVAARELARTHAAGERDPLDTLRAALDRVEAVGPRGEDLNCLLSSDRTAAQTAVRELPGGSLALRGVPVVVKDNIATLGLPTTCASRVLEHYVSPYEATVVRRLREAGAIIVGKSNLDEFAMGSSTEHSAFGPTRNPVDRSRVPGGSSGGSAAAVAAGIAPIALGSETGGSVRQPAAFCGVVGVKPTYGRVSRFGLVAFASSLDQVGVFGRTVDDAALGLAVIAGHDPRDATSADEPVRDHGGERGAPLRGLVVGRPREYFAGSLDPRIVALCDRAAETLRAAGAEIRDVSLPHTALAIPAYYVIAPAECSSNLARFDGARYGLRVEGDGLGAMYEATRSRGFGDEVIRRVLLGTWVLSAGYYDAYYRKAMQVRALIADDFRQVFANGVDCLLTPTAPTPAFPLGAIADPYEMYLSDVFTVTANLAGLPGISVPAGRVDGLPIGVQLLGRRFDEATLFRAAFAIETALGREAHR
jgi:aspartyl-tRNA(Asn)/glutamyl-tRNA(Gln) amidotransferase subunit A